jgi:hypothetical protein
MIYCKNFVNVTNNIMIKKKKKRAVLESGLSLTFSCPPFTSPFSPQGRLWKLVFFFPRLRHGSSNLKFSDLPCLSGSRPHFRRGPAPHALGRDAEESGLAGLPPQAPAQPVSIVQSHFI